MPHKFFTWHNRDMNPTPPTQTQWLPDILGPGFESLPLELPSGDRATLVRYLPRVDNHPSRGVPHLNSVPQVELDSTAVLYIHGWSDYFYNRDLARFWTHMGAHFYAVDLRNYGRNLDLSDPERTPGLIDNLGAYDEEISASLDVITGLHPHCRVVLNAHSTGGLTAALWANDNPGRITGLVLNSPWLEFQYTASVRKLLGPLMAARNPVSPLRIALPNYYVLAVAQAHGDTPFDLRLKPPESFPVYPQFLRAVFDGHRRVEHGLSLDIPVLVQMSRTSMQSVNYAPQMAHADIVLDVDILARRALDLADTVIVDRVPGAMHDVYLSEETVRDQAFIRIMKFARGYLD